MFVHYKDLLQRIIHVSLVASPLLNVAIHIQVRAVNCGGVLLALLEAYGDSPPITSRMLLASSGSVTSGVLVIHCEFCSSQL